MKNNILFKECKDDNLWKTISEDEAYASFRNNLKDAWQVTEDKVFLPLGFELFMTYLTKGSAREYGKEYYARRLGLNASFMSYMLYRDEKYLKKLEEIIMLILDEYTWAFPSHIKELTDCETVSTYIDLFSAETGQALSEILYILEDKLDVRISSRIRYEINRRIISSFLKNNFSFEQSFSNWATVCAGSVGMIFIYMCPEKFPLIKERIKACFHNYLTGFEDDGACAEGPGYWVYGFGYYIYFEELYREFSGQYLIQMTSKHKNIAMFLQKIHISGQHVISFSDGSDKEFLMNGIVCKVSEIFGDDVRVLPEDAYAPPVMGGDNCYRFAHCIRNFLWHNPDKMTTAKPPKSEKIYFEDAQWYIKKTPEYFFAAKGGKNDDPHNHNDVGSFLISDYENQLLTDLGKGEYDKFYFDPETRYSKLCCSSRGHSLPIIDGCEQSPGKEFSAKNVEESDSHLSMDISGAYDNPDVTSLIRSFTFDDKSVILNDEIIRKNDSVWIDRLVSVIEPVVDGNIVIIGKMKIECSCDIEPVVTVDEMSDHFTSEKYPVYLIDYKTNANSIEFKFIF